MSRLIQSVLILLLLQFRPAAPGYKYEFPRDHGAHPEYGLEWWYYTGQVRAADGHEFGYELTFFRTGVQQTNANPSSWSIRDLYMAHFAVTDISSGKFYYFEQLHRAGPGVAGSTVGALRSWNANWSAVGDGEGMKLKAQAGAAKIELTLDPKKPPTIHGVDGISQKAEGAGHASHYYSMTRLGTTGTLEINGAKFQVVGDSWMDHEFGTNQLTDKQVGWDWFSIQLDNGVDLMLYRMRNRDGTLDPYSSGTIVDSKVRHLGISEFSASARRSWTSPETGTAYPLEWIITVGASELHITPLLDNQELVTRKSTGIAYWEGAIGVTGVWEGKPVKGKGYLELTGYAEKDRPRV